MRTYALQQRLQSFIISLFASLQLRKAEETQFEVGTSRYIIALGSCFKNAESSLGFDLVSVQPVIDLPDVREILLFRRTVHGIYHLLDRWSVSDKPLDVLPNLIQGHWYCFGVEQGEANALSWPATVGQSKRRQRPSSRAELNQTYWVLTKRRNGFVIQSILQESTHPLVSFRLGFVESCCSHAWQAYIEEKLRLVQKHAPAHPCLARYKSVKDDFTFFGLDVWQAFIKHITSTQPGRSVSSTSHQEAVFLRRIMDIARITSARLSPESEHDPQSQPQMKTACPALHLALMRLNAFNMLAPVVHFLASDTQGAQLLTHLHELMLFWKCLEPGSIENFQHEHEGLSPSYATSFDATFIRLEQVADRIYETMRSHAEVETKQSWHTDMYAPSYWSDTLLSVLGCLLLSGTAALPLPPSNMFRQDMLLTFMAISGDTGEMWEYQFDDVLNLLQQLQHSKHFEYWPSGGNLVGLLRYGHAVGQIAPGLEDVVDDDIDIDIRADNVAHVFDIALTLAKILVKSKNWLACWFTGHSSSKERYTWKKGLPYNRGAVVLTCYKVVARGEDFHKFQMDIHFYFLRAEDDRPQALPKGPSWGQVVVPIRRNPLHHRSRLVLVENEVLFGGKFYYMDAHRPYSARLVFPLGQCLLMSKFLKKGRAVAVPCPNQPVRFLKYHYIERGLVTGCFALPRVMKKRNLLDPRTRKLALGITHHHIDSLRKLGAQIAHYGFKSFTDEDFNECNVSQDAGARYDTLDCETSRKTPYCDEIKQYVLESTTPVEANSVEHLRVSSD